MFGYIRPYKPEMKVKDYSVYKAVYCGLCHTLGNRFGFLSRMILSYDATLLSILDMSVKKGCGGFEQKNCPVRPFKKCDCSKFSPELDYWADASVILSYYKVKDNIHDARAVKKAAALAVLPFFSHGFRKAKNQHPFIAICAEDYIKKQDEVEAKRCKKIDEAAQPTAELMSRLMKRDDDSAQGRIFARMGYFLGRWIYLADAADDIKEDLESKNYNPFIEEFGITVQTSQSEIKKIAQPLLNSCVYEITAAFNLLETKRFSPILENVFYNGLPQMQRAVLSGLSLKDKKKKFAAMYRI